MTFSKNEKAFKIGIDILFLNSFFEDPIQIYNVFVISTSSASQNPHYSPPVSVQSVLPIDPGVSVISRSIGHLPWQYVWRKLTPTPQYSTFNSALPAGRGGGTSWAPPQSILGFWLCDDMWLICIPPQLLWVHGCNSPAMSRKQFHIWDSFPEPWGGVIDTDAPCGVEHSVTNSPVLKMPPQCSTT